MNERLQAALDGEIPAEDLTAAERSARAVFEAGVSALRADLGDRTPRTLDGAVMRRIRDLGLEPLPVPAEPLVRRIARAAWTARDVHVRVRPLPGLAAAAVLAALLVSGGVMLGGGGLDAAPPPAAAATGDAPIYVQFRLEAGAASNVAVAGSFSDWQPARRMQRTVDGVWTVLLPLQPGVHDYGFIVDGDEWVPDPYAPQVDDGFGGVNSRLTVLVPSDRL
jgi:hypothetical protein